MKKFLKVILVVFIFSAVANAFDYSSVWFNKNRNTSGITKLVIKSNGLIKAFGKCHPRACDWGFVRYNRTRNGLLASWRQRGIGHKVVLVESINRNSIRVIVKYLYNDSRRDKTAIEYFKKVNLINAITPVKKFIGFWKSSNPNTRGLTRATIYRVQNRLKVKMWGKCHPTDCPWGVANAILSGDKLIVNWHQGFVNRKMIIKGYNLINGKYRNIRVKTISVYNDNRGTKVAIENLRRVGR